MRLAVRRAAASSAAKLKRPAPAISAGRAPSTRARLVRKRPMSMSMRGASLAERSVARLQEGAHALLGEDVEEALLLRRVGADHDGVGERVLADRGAGAHEVEGEAQAALLHLERVRGNLGEPPG